MLYNLMFLLPIFIKLMLIMAPITIMIILKIQLWGFLRKIF